MIQARGLEKSFVKQRSIRELIAKPLGTPERVEALRGVDLEVARGEIVSLLGPNGAGKTTLIKVLTCLVLPDKGEATIDGISTEKENQVKPKLGLVTTDERSFYWRLSARENLRFFARLYDVPSEKIDPRIDELLARVELEQAADRQFSTFSSGMKQRVAVIRALLHDPPIVFMDEPTRSLDPTSTLALRRFVRDELQARDNKTVVIATHDLAEAAAISDRVAIVAAGKIRQIGTVEEVRRWGIADRTLEIQARGEGFPEGPWKLLQDEPMPGHRRLRVLLEEGGTTTALLKQLLDNNLEVDSCTKVEPDLEEAFARIIEDEKAEARA